MAKDRTVKCTCDRTGIEGRRLLVLGKEAVSANQVRDSYGQEEFTCSCKLSGTDGVATMLDALDLDMPDTGLTKGNALYMKGRTDGEDEWQ
jgi:hypothetical protein